MIRELKKDEFFQSTVGEMKPNQSMLILTDTYADFETARQKVSNYVKRVGLPEGIDHFRCDRTPTQKCLITAFANKES